MNKEQIPFLDLYAQYQSLKSDLDAAWERCIAHSSFIGGEPVRSFEQEFSTWLGVDHVVSCANGTDSIEILLEAYGIGSGDEVIVPCHTWFSTAEAVSRVGAIPVFADCDDRTFTLIPDHVAGLIGSRTKAIIPVHLFGHPAPMGPIMDLAQKHGLVVIEDCAQSHGATYQGKLTGTIGHAASFSFYPGKNLGCYGDGGAMATFDPKIAEKARMIAQHGQKEKHTHFLAGRNSRLDTLQAEILRVKLPHLREWNRKRQEVADWYREDLRDIPGLQLPKVAPECSHVYHQFTVQLENREHLMKELGRKGIGYAVYYPKLVPLQPAYNPGGETGLFAAEKYLPLLLSLPIYPELQRSHVTEISSVIAAVVQKDTVE